MIQLLIALVVFSFVGIKIYSGFAREVIGYRKPYQVRPQDHEIDGYLKQIAFYNQLNNSDKHEFLERVQYMLGEKVFQGMQGQVITNEVRTIVAASAVQIAFRLENWKLPSFHTIRIYPECFYSNLFRKYLKGGAGQTGQIWFSLEDYRAGYANPTNGINLGLHEMAHALIIEMENGTFGHEFTQAYEHIEKLALDRMPKIRSGEITFIREYAGTNHMEFIAVCTEVFFEQADEFRLKDRELYDAFMWLYKQEPHTPPSILQITNLPRPERVKRNYRFSKWHWSLTLVLIGIFIAPGVLIFLMKDVALSFGMSWAVAGIVFVASAYLLYKPIVKSGALGTTQFFLCHIVGLWPLVFSVVLLINNFVPVWKQGDVHRISRINWENTAKAVVTFSDNAYSEDADMRMVLGLPTDKLHVGDYVVVVHNFGVFGIPVYGDNLVVRIPEKKDHAIK